MMLSWPIMVSDGLRAIGPTIDMIWIGKLGLASVAGLGLGGMTHLIIMLGLMGINTGMRAMVSRFVGAGDIVGANHVAQQALVISTVYAIVVGAIGILFAEQILTH